MAKPIIKFSAVPYQVGSGTQIRTGLRPQLEAQNGLYDLDFCKEVVNEKRLSMSADELLHAMEMVGEVGPAKVASDGRPRGITKLLKFNRYAQGNLESPTSPWNETCRAYVRAQLMWDAEKEIVATFQNVDEGIGVKLNYVAWVGAQSVTNVVKIGKLIGVYGNHMEFLAGDTAQLTVGTTVYPLVCTESDVAHAVFAWPAGLAPEAGTLAEFLMKSRGGIEEGQVYTSKKTVTILAADAPLPTVTKVATSGKDGIAKGSAFDAEGTNIPAGSSVPTKVRWMEDGVAKELSLTPAGVTATKISYAAVSAFDAVPVGTELTFEFTIDESSVNKATSVVA